MPVAFAPLDGLDVRAPELARAAIDRRYAALASVRAAPEQHVLDVRGSTVLRSSDLVVPGDYEVVDAHLTADDKVIVTAAAGGTENDTFYLAGMQLLGGERRVLGAVWSRDRTACLYGLDDGSIWLGDPRRTPVEIFARPGVWLPLDIARDGRSVLVQHEVSPVVSTVFLVDVATGKASPITPIGDRAFARAKFGRDGEIVVQDDEQLAVLRGGARIPIALDEIIELAVSDDGSHIAYTTGRTTQRLVTVELATGERASRSTGGVATELHWTEANELVWTLSTPRLPPHEMRGLAGDDPPDLPVKLRIDQVMIEGRIPTLIYRPAEATAKLPVLVELHGGPEDRWRPSYDARALALVAQGYAVVRPDVRGSAGYGRAYVEADDRRNRERAVDDVGSVLQWVTEQGALDVRRIAIAGRSYGGWLALASANRYHFVRGAIDRSGIVDLGAFLATTAVERRDQRRFEYGDERDPATRFRLDKLAIRDLPPMPVLVEHGRRDARVPIGPTLALLAARPDAWSAIGADEGHVFSRLDHRAYIEAIEDEFLATVLRSR